MRPRSEIMWSLQISFNKIIVSLAVWHTAPSSWIQRSSTWASSNSGTKNSLIMSPKHSQLAKILWRALFLEKCDGISTVACCKCDNCAYLCTHSLKVGRTKPVRYEMASQFNGGNLVTPIKTTNPEMSIVSLKTTRLRQHLTLIPIANSNNFVQRTTTLLQSGHGIFLIQLRTRNPYDPERK